MSKKDFKKISAVVFMAVLGGVVGFFAASMGLKAAENMSTSLVIVIGISIIPSFFLMIALHELGHALAGSLQKFEFKLFVVGPLLWQNENGTWRFHWNKNVNLSGGMVLSLPNDTVRLTERFLWFVAGGPLASLAGAIVFFLCHSLLSSYASSTFAQATSSILFIWSFISAVLFVVTIVPSRTGGFASDGARILRILRGGDAARLEVLLLQLVSTSMTGQRPSSWNADQLEEALQLANKLEAPTEVYLHGLSFHSAWDRGDLVVAEQSLQQYLANIDAVPPGFQNGVWLDAALFNALVKKDVKQALHFWSKFKPTAVVGKAQVLATEAAIALLQEEHTRAVEKIEQAISELPNMLDAGSALALRDRLVRMRKQLQEERLPDALLTLPTH